MNKFTSKDEEGRVKFQQYCSTTTWCKYNKASKDEYAAWDVSYTSGATQVIGEIKLRDYASDAFDGWFMEEKKLKALHAVREAVKSKYKHSTTTPSIHYINIFTDDKIIIWDVTNLDAVVETHNLQQTTMGNQQEVSKAIITLPTATAVIRESLTPPPIGNPNANPEDDGLPF